MFIVSKLTILPSMVPGYNVYSPPSQKIPNNVSFDVSAAEYDPSGNVASLYTDTPAEAAHCTAVLLHTSAEILRQLHEHKDALSDGNKDC